MRRAIIIMIVILANNLFGQSLDKLWNNIQQKYAEKKYSELVNEIPVFLDSLTNNKLENKKLLPLIYLGESYGQLLKFTEMDSCFDLAVDLNYKFKSTSFYSIRDRQISTYSNIYSNHGELIQDKIRFLKKMISLSKQSFLTKQELWFTNQLAELNYKNNDFPEATSLLEEALDLAISSNQDKNKITKIKSNLFDLYLKSGEDEKAFLLVNATDTLQFQTAVFKYSQKLINQGRFEDADKMLISIEGSLLRGSNDDLIVSYAKKRLFLFKSLNRFSDGLDTLNKFIERALSNLPDHKTLNFQLEKICILGNFSEGNLDTVDTLLTKMDTNIEKGFYPEKISGDINFLHGDLNYLRGKTRQAIDFYVKAKSEGNSLSFQDNLTLQNNLGLANYRLGNFEKSLNIFSEMSSIDYDSTNIKYLITAYINKGIIYNKLGNYNKALENFELGYKLSDEHSLSKYQILTQLRMSEAYRFLGRTALSNKIFDSIKNLYDKIEEPLPKLQLLKALASYERSLDNLSGANFYLEKAFKIANESGFNNYSSILSGELANIYMNGGNYEKAVKMFVNQLSINSVLESRLITALKIAQCYINLGSYDSAEVTLQNSLIELDSKSEELSANSKETMEALHLRSLILTMRSFVKFSKGIEQDDIQLIVDAYDEIKKVVVFSKANFFSEMVKSKNSDDAWIKNLNSFNTLVDIAIELFNRTSNNYYLEDAFNTIEELRAQTFVSEVGEQIVNKLNDPAAKKLADLTENESPISNSETSLENEFAVSEEDELSVRGIKVIKEKKDYFSLQKKYDETINDLKNDSSKVLNIFSLNTLKLNNVRDFLDDQMIILSYYSNNSATYIFLIDKSDMFFHKLNLSGNDLAEIVSLYRRQIQQPNNSDYLKTSEKIYSYLIKPFSDKIDGKTLLIVPAGKLHNLPFSSLYDGRQFLAEKNDLTLLPNISALQFIYRNKKDLTMQKVLALGNPTNPSGSDLPGAEKEVKHISQIFPKTLLLTQNKATESEVKLDSPNFDVIHFACHGIFNADFPLMSFLLLSPDNINDGKLEVHEIYNLNLSRTKLVVMSACETGLAEIKKNDDMIGLVRGFLYAGVPSIVSSLWKVNDSATYGLMSDFYLFLKQGLSKSKSIRKAQTNMIHSNKFHHPFYWAAFTLNGLTY